MRGSVECGGDMIGEGSVKEDMTGERIGGVWGRHDWCGGGQGSVGRA